MPAPSTSTPVEAFPYCSVLAKVLPPREHQAITTSTFLTPKSLTAITLVAVGHTLRSAAEAMGAKPTTLTSYLASAAQKLGCLQRVSMLVHRAYSHPDFPAPDLISRPAPDLDAYEWTVLSAHADGVMFKQLRESRGLTEFALTDINHSLMAKLEADSRPHAVRRAWQYGLLPRITAPAGLGAGGRVS
ncbi:hypothetical protein [Streptomyces triculaminicus]|uniref:hypothetical protein n=1 Tax=Streptomyces triculaminicus TaxID=2816232 RepID=UPI0037D8DC86